MLQMHNICKSFNINDIEKRTIFTNFNVNINEGDFITIIGSNGAGKSTLLNVISGSIPVDDGEIILENKNIEDMQEYKRTKFIGRVFQDPSMGTCPSMTILENLSMAFNKGNKFNLNPLIDKKNITFFKEELSKLSLGLENNLNKKVAQLSGGQRQALSLIMASFSKPKLLLLDEHTAALDPETAERILNLTERIVEENNTTTLMITHNLNHAIRFGNRLWMMHKGKIMFDLNKEEKKNLKVDDLLSLFKKSQIDDLSDEMLLS